MSGQNLRRAVPAIPSHLAELRHAVVDLARTAGAADRPCADIALAVSEACGNVIAHAYRGTNGPGQLVVEASVNGRELHVSVCDEGQGLAPRADSAGMGLGLPLITSLTSSVSIGPAPGGGGTRVEMVFSLDVEKR